MTVLGLALAALNLAAQNPEEVYLVGSFNNWDTPNQAEAPVTMTSEGDGIYTYTLENRDTGLEFKIFTAKTDWSQQDSYWGASMDAPASVTLFKGIPVTWNMAQGYDGANFSISNAANIAGPIKLRLDWNAKTMTAESDYAPAISNKFSFELNGDPASTARYTLTRTSEENPYLYTGEWEIPAGKLEGWFVNSDGKKSGVREYKDVYVWRNLGVGFTLESQNNANAVPFHIDNWKGGKLSVYYDLNTNYCTVVSNTQPELPERVYLVTNPKADGTWSPADCSLYLDLFSNNGRMAYYGSVNLPVGGFSFKFGVEGLDNLIGTNDGPMEVFSNATTPFTLSGSADAKPLTCSNWAGGEITFDIHAGLCNGTVTQAPGQPVQAQTIYLVGAPQGWNINSDAMPLVSDETGVNFYGNYEIKAGEAMFRFYTQLGSWDANSIGYQYDDITTDFEMTDGAFSDPYVYGKGNWNFPTWPGGMMYLHVNMENQTVEFSDQDNSCVDGINAGSARVVTFKGGVRVEGADGAVDIFDIQGRRVASLRNGESATLAPGIYLSRGQKLLVK